MGMVFRRIGLRQLSGAVSPWNSDTLWGQICWVYRDLYGEDALKTVLEGIGDGTADFVLSDAFPAGFLPVPAGGQIFHLPPETREKAGIIERIERVKQSNRLRYLPADRFFAAMAGEKIDADIENPREIHAVQMHTAIDRETNTVQQGSLFQETVRYASERRQLDLYALSREDFPLLECLDALAAQGIGGGVSRGNGAFCVESTEVLAFPRAEDANAFVTISRCTPSAEMPTDAQYHLSIKAGMHGRERSAEGQPFKRPVIQLEPGAVFWGKPPENGYCGSVVRGVSYAYPDAVQCGLAIALPARMER